MVDNAQPACDAFIVISTLREAELADMVDDGTGLLGRLGFPTPAPAAIAHGGIEDGRLVWHWLDTKPAKTDGALDAFLAIATATDVLRFARRYGPLLLCEHGYPYTHPPEMLPPSVPNATRCTPTTWLREREAAWIPRGESVDQWLKWVHQANVIVRSTAAIRRPDLLSLPPEITNRLLPAEVVGSAEPTVRARATVADLVSHWLFLADVRPEILWFEGDPEVRLGTETFGLLGVQLMTAIASSSALATCDGCGLVYPAKRRPRADQRNFCSPCGERVAGKLRAQRYRERRRVKDDEAS